MSLVFSKMAEGSRVWELKNQIRKLQLRANILRDIIQEGISTDSKARKDWNNRSFELQLLEEEIEQLYEELDGFTSLL